MSNNNSWESKALQLYIKKKWYSFLTKDVNKENYPTKKKTGEHSTAVRSAIRAVNKLVNKIEKGTENVDSSVSSRLDNALEELADKLDARIGACEVLRKGLIRSNQQLNLIMQAASD